MHPSAGSVLFLLKATRARRVRFFPSPVLRHYDLTWREGTERLAGSRISALDSPGACAAALPETGPIRGLVHLAGIFVAHGLDDVDHTAGCSDLRDLYDDLCIAEGAPIYLSDGMYLGSDGRLL